MKQRCRSSRPIGAAQLRSMTFVMASAMLSSCAGLSSWLPDTGTDVESGTVAGSTAARMNADGRVLDGRARGRFDTSTSSAGHKRTGAIAAYPRDLGRGRHTVGAAGIEQRWRPERRIGDADGDGVDDADDHCPTTDAHVTVNPDGCGLFDTVLDAVIFDSHSHVLVEQAREQLDQLAETLLAFPESRVRIVAHTDSQGRADENLRLSSARADAVRSYLRSRGVDASQVQAVGMGAMHPRVPNDDHLARLQNRRVEVVTLPDRDAGESRAQPLPFTQQQRMRLVARAENMIPRRAGSASAATGPVIGAVEPAMQAALPTNARPGESGTHRAPVLPLPEPGIAPAAGIAGIVRGLGFEPGSSALGPAAEAALSSVGQTLLEHPEVSIVVMAHTDDVGDAHENLALSRARADAVVAHLVSRGVAADRLDAEGYGELLPLVQNMTEADRATNRRVEIRIQRR